MVHLARIASHTVDFLSDGLRLVRPVQRDVPGLCRDTAADRSPALKTFLDDLRLGQMDMQEQGFGKLTVMSETDITFDGYPGRLTSDPKVYERLSMNFINSFNLMKEAVRQANETAVLQKIGGN